MKLVREYIDFERGVDPKVSMGIGRKQMIDKWFDSFPFHVEYDILDDGRIRIQTPCDLQSQEELFPGGKLPDFIDIAKSDDFDVDDCKINSLRGFPEIISGYFSCQMNNLMSLDGSPRVVQGGYYCNGNPGEFTMEEVKEYCEVGEEIQADDTPEW